MTVTLTPTDVFKCLADDTRAKMVLLIDREKELCVCELTHALNQSQPKISRHLALLRASGVLIGRRRSQWVYYRLNPDLPQWVSDMLTLTNNASGEWLQEQSRRLVQMGDRAARIAANC